MDDLSEQTLRDLKRKRNDAISNPKLREQTEDITDGDRLNVYVNDMIRTQSSFWNAKSKSRSFSKFCSSINQFLEAHKAIGDIARAAHPQISGLTFGCFSLLVQVGRKL